MGAHPHPLPGVCRAFVILSVPAVWNLKPLAGDRAFVNFVLDSYRYFCKEYF